MAEPRMSPEGPRGRDISMGEIVSPFRGPEPLPFKRSPGTEFMRNNLAYDRELQMFVEPSAELNVGRLRFLRWLAEMDKLEHEAYGPPGGPLVNVVAMSELRAASSA